MRWKWNVGFDSGAAQQARDRSGWVDDKGVEWLAWPVGFRWKQVRLLFVTLEFRTWLLSVAFLGTARGCVSSDSGKILLGVYLDLSYDISACASVCESFRGITICPWAVFSFFQ